MVAHSIPAKLNILFASTSYPADENDWRGKFNARLVEALSRIDSLHMAVWAPPGKIPAIVRDASSRAEAHWLGLLMKSGGIAQVMRRKGPMAALTVLKLIFYLKAAYRRERDNDLVHVNWLQNALPLWGYNIPAVVSVLGSDFGMLDLFGMQFLMRHVFKQRRTIIVPNADWMAPRLKRAFGDVAEIRPIAFGVDKKWFALHQARFDSTRIHWLAVTRITVKKIGDLFDWGQGCFGKRHILHLLGPLQEEVTLPEWAVYHGPVSPTELFEKWFPCASGLISLSRHNEGRPQVMLESMAAGLPIIASDIPAHQDIVQHGVNGWIVSNPQDLRDALAFFSKHEAIQQAGQNARSWVFNNIGTWDDCAERYAKAYRDIKGRME